LFKKALKISHSITSGKHYGEGAHWDEFLNAYKRALFKTYTNPIEQAPMAVSFMMGVATHRVSDDIWHNGYDTEGQNANLYQFKTCNKSRSPSDCYVGFISKLADLETLGWSTSHTIADIGIDLALIKDRGMSERDYPAPTQENVPYELLVSSYNDPEVQYKWPVTVTRDDLVKDFAAYTLTAVAGILALDRAGTLGIYKMNIKWIGLGRTTKSILMLA
jgi:hypothetical protein